MKHIKESINKKVVPLKTRQKKIIDTVLAHEDEQGKIVYLHSAMCQTSLPLKNPGETTRVWDSQNGKVSLRVKAGEVLNPENQWIDLGLPFGPKPRLILCYLNTKAMLAQSATIEVEDSLKAFIEKMGLDANGRDFRTVKDQLARLSASDITIGAAFDERRTTTVQGHVVKRFDLWFPKDKNQRVMWPSEIELSRDYFEALLSHAVPLDQMALAMLKDSALELDLYAMLAERLHRIKPGVTQEIYWTVLYEQYGRGYKRLRDFRRQFLGHLKNVHAVYPTARIDSGTGGLKLYHSKPPISKVSWLIGDKSV